MIVIAIGVDTIASVNALIVDTYTSQQILEGSYRLQACALGIVDC